MKFFLICFFILSAFLYCQDNDFYLIDTLEINGAESVEKPYEILNIEKGDTSTLDIINMKINLFKKAYNTKAAFICGFWINKQIDEQNRKINLFINICEYEWVSKISIKGNLIVSDSLVLEAIDMNIGMCYKKNIINNALKKISTLYDKKDIDADIDFKISGGIKKEICFYINETKPQNEILIYNNDFFDTEKIINIITNNKTNIHKTELLIENLDSLLKEYHKEGFLDANVDFSINSNVFKLFVNENERHVIDSIILIGNDNLNNAVIIFNSQYKKQKYCTENNLKRIADNIITFYENNGFPFCELTVDSLFKKHKKIVVVYKIKENGRYRLGKFYFKGNRKTKDYVLDRFVNIQKNNIFSQEKLEKARSRILKSGIFTEVKDPYLSLRNHRRTADIIFDVTEKKHNSAEGILGYIQEEDASPLHGYFKLFLGNIAGTYRKINLEYLKERSLTDASFNYFEPWLLNTFAEAEVLLKFVLEDNSYAYWSSQLRIFFPLNAHLKVYAGLSRLSNTYIPENDTLNITETSTHTQFGIKYDTRDFPLNPNQGFYVDLPFYYIRKQGVNNTYNELKLELFSEMFYELFKYNILYSNIMLKSLITKDYDLSRGELFGLGGVSTVRGYRENRFYVRNFILFKNEYRFITGPMSRFIFFFDLASYSNADFLREPLDYNIIFGYGIGLRISSKAGIIGLDFGLSKKSSFDNGKIHLRIKNNF